MKKPKTVADHDVFTSYLCRSAFGHMTCDWNITNRLSFKSARNDWPRRFRFDLDGELFDLPVVLEQMYQEHATIPGKPQYTCLENWRAADCMRIRTAFLHLAVLGTPQGCRHRNVYNPDDPENRYRDSALRAPKVKICRLVDGDYPVITMTAAAVYLMTYHTTNYTCLRVEGTWKECESFFQTGAKYIHLPTKRDK